MKPLTSGVIDAFLNAKNKGGRLQDAYLIAGDPRAWAAEQEKKDQEAALAGGVKSEEE